MLYPAQTSYLNHKISSAAQAAAAKAAVQVLNYDAKTDPAKIRMLQKKYIHKNAEHFAALRVSAAESHVRSKAGRKAFSKPASSCTVAAPVPTQELADADNARSLPTCMPDQSGISRANSGAPAHTEREAETGTETAASGRERPRLPMSLKKRRKVEATGDPLPYASTVALRAITSTARRGDMVASLSPAADSLLAADLTVVAL